MLEHITTAADILNMKLPPAERKYRLPEPFTVADIKKYEGRVPFMDVTLYASLKGRGKYQTIDLDLYTCSFNLTKDIQSKIMSTYRDYLTTYPVVGGLKNSFVTSLDIYLKVRTEDVDYWLGTLGALLNNPRSTYDIGLDLA